MVLLINNQYWAEIFAQEPGNGARSMRHAAYRQFVLWRHGRLGNNIRRVIPSCVVWRIRDRFPSPDNLYTGYQVSRLAWWGEPLGHACVVTLHQLCCCGRAAGCQRSADSAWVARQHLSSTQYRLTVDHPPSHDLRLHLTHVAVVFRDLHWYSVPIGRYGCCTYVCT